MKFKLITILIIFFVFLSFLSFNCASTKNEISKKDTETLKEMYLQDNWFSIRNKILLELERRKEVDALISGGDVCYEYFIHPFYRRC